MHLPTRPAKRFAAVLVALTLAALCPFSTSASAKPNNTIIDEAPSPKKSHKAKTKRQKTATKKASATPSVPRGIPYATRADVMERANEIAQRCQLRPEWVREVLGQARYLPSVAKAILPPAVGVPKNWTLYRSRFIDSTRIQAGVKFWQANRETLQRAQANTGVPAAIIVGIIGVETIYGQQTGNFRVLDALATLAFDFPQAHPKAAARSQFFLSELEAFLTLTERTQTDPLALRGSYAGAMGLPQFMPSSWQKYAIDFDGDGRIDLFHSAADVIGSVANYFQAFQWKPGMPTHYPVRFNTATLDKPTLLAPDILPSFTAAEMAAKGVELPGPALTHQGPLALVELQNGDAEPLYIAGTENFYTITRYNWSSYYALAVIELGQAIAAAMPAPALVPVLLPALQQK
jgi:membrane-bound lytic murein transglycosylase B